MLTARRKQCQGEKGIGISDPLDWESENGREGEMAREGGAEKSLRRESGATEQGSYSCPTSLCFASTCELCVCLWLSFLLTSSEPKLFAPPSTLSNSNPPKPPHCFPPSLFIFLCLSRVSCWAFVPEALWGIIQCGRSFARLSGKWGQSRGSQSFIHIS